MPGGQGAAQRPPPPQQERRREHRQKPADRAREQYQRSRRAVVAERAGQRLWVVTHVGVVRTLLCHLLGVPVSDALRFAPAVASHTGVLHSEAGAVLTSFGERPWLGATDARVAVDAGELA